MEQKCIETDQIAAVLALPPDDPRRRHLDECPRCASRLLLYRQFLEAKGAPGADPDAADAHLAAVMKDEINRSAAPAVQKKRGGLLTWAARGIPAWVGTTIVVLVLVVLWWQPWTTDEIVFRGDQSKSAAPQLVLESPTSLEDGGVRLAWRPVEGADGYLIRFRTPDLDEIALLGPFSDTSFVVTRKTFPTDTSLVVFWRVIALRNGDEILQSRPASLELP